MKRRFIAVVGLALLALVAFGGRARATDTTRELLVILRAKGEITEEQYQALLAQLDADAAAKAKTAAAKPGQEWLDRFSLFGDMRVRGEGFYQKDVDDRDRFRVRARLGVTAKASDELDGTVRIATGDPNDPISTNQTLTNLFTRKPVSLDQAYLTFKPSSTFGWDRPYLTLTGGKLPGTVVRPKAQMGSELVFDDDITPEGFNEVASLVDSKDGLVRKLTLQGAEWSAQEMATASDSWIFGGQGLTSLGLGAATVTVSFGDYYLSNANRIAQQANTDTVLTITNDVVLKDGTVAGGTPLKVDPANPIVRYRGGFNILNPNVQVGIPTWSSSWPATVFVDFAHNTAAQRKPDGYWIGASLGQTVNPGDFAVSAMYAQTETNAVISALSFSDFGKSGGTNLKGPAIKLEWMPLSRLVLSVKNHFVTFIDAPAGKSNATLNRLQVDAQYSF